MNFAYPAKLEPQKDGSVLVTFPDLRGVVTDGDDEEDALREAADALAAGIAIYIGEREDIPEPSKARGRPLVAVEPELAAKAALYAAMRKAKVSNVALAKRLDVTEGAVRSMLDPKRTAKIGTLAKALGEMGLDVTVSVGPLPQATKARVKPKRTAAKRSAERKPPSKPVNIVDRAKRARGGARSGRMARRVA